MHALGQVAGFTLERAIAPDAVARALNARLPGDIRVIGAEEVPADFHPRFVSQTKTYRYRIWNADVMAPFERRYAWHIIERLDVEAMTAAARVLEGRHDFAAFQAAGGSTKTTERIVSSSVISRTASEEPLVTYDISGNGFLRYMVRNIVGTLVEVGRGRRPGEWVAEVLRSGWLSSGPQVKAFEDTWRWDLGADHGSDDQVDRRRNNHAVGFHLQRTSHESYTRTLWYLLAFC